MSNVCVLTLCQHVYYICLLTPCQYQITFFQIQFSQHLCRIVSSFYFAKSLSDKGYAIAFALDTDDDYVWQIVNGASTLPQTIVLDRNGVVVYNQKGSVTPEILAALYEQASSIK